MSSTQIKVEFVLNIPSNDLNYLDDENIEKKVTESQLRDWIFSELSDISVDMSENPLEYKVLIADASDIHVEFVEVEDNVRSKCSDKGSEGA